MDNQKLIVCAFCQGVGENPHFTGTCPVCKGKGKNTLVGPFMICRDCRGSGQKRGTTLTCYTCVGLGVLPDTREIVAQARTEIKEAREEMEKERPARQQPEPRAMAGGQEFREGSQVAQLPPKTDQPFAGKKQTRKKVDESEDPKEELFCQCCGSKVKKESTLKICLGCFQRISKG